MLPSSPLPGLLMLTAGPCSWKCFVALNEQMDVPAQLKVCREKRRACCRLEGAGGVGQRRLPSISNRIERMPHDWVLRMKPVHTKLTFVLASIMA
jgi:hypothetical protein